MTTPRLLALPATCLAAALALSACGSTPASVNHAPIGRIAAPADGTVTITPGSSVTFSGSCVDADGDALSSVWTFGGGAATSNKQSPGAVVFATAGTYTVIYTCTDAKGLADSAPPTRVVKVVSDNPPVATITSPAADVTIGAGDSVSFEGACSDPDATDTVFTYAWLFGGAAPKSTAANPGAIQFPNAGTFTVTFTCYDSSGVADLTPDLRTITVTGVGGNHAPTGSITAPATDTTINAGDSVTFQGACTDPDAGDTATHLWSFGGGAATSTAQSPGPVTFANAGTFTVTYTCTDGHGAADPAPPQRTITVLTIVNHAPNGTITAPASDAAIPIGGTVSFAATCTDPDPGDGVNHLWSFGGGAATSTLQNPGAVVFSTAGTYTVTYTCTDVNGLADPTPDTRTVTVSSGNHAPESTISAPAVDTTISAGASVTFTGVCADPDAGDDTFTYAWSFGSGAPASTVLSPGAVAFATPGTYPVTFTCTDAHGAADPTPATRTITVTSGGAVYTLSGTATFDKVPSTAYNPTTGQTKGLDYAHVVKKPIRGAEMVIVEAANLNNVLVSGVTGSDGTYTLSWPKTGPSAVKVIVYSRTHSPKMIVEDNTANNAVYALSSSTVDATAITTVDLYAAHGWNGTSYVTRAASPFAVLDSIWQATQGFLAVRPLAVFPDLHANWSAKNQPVDPTGTETQAQAYANGHISTSHWNGEELYLLGQVNVDTDEFDDHVVVHEWGHYFETMLGRSDSPGGNHGFGDLKDPTLAWSEGWGNGLSGIIWAPNSIYTDASGSKQASGFGLDVEDNSSNEDPNPGWFSEATVQAVLYDLFDSGSTEAWDTIALGLGPIYDVQTGAQKTTSAATTLFSFIAGLKAANPGSVGAIDTLTAYRGALGVPVADAYGTGETNNGFSAVNLPVYRTIVAATPLTVTMTGDAVDGNELGQNRYLRFQGDGKSHTVHIATTDTTFDADVYVTLKGDSVTYTAGPSGTETTDPFVATAGAEYLILINGWGDGSTPTPDYDVVVTVN
jgi:hypothetical protein